MTSLNEHLKFYTLSFDVSDCNVNAVVNALAKAVCLCDLVRIRNLGFAVSKNAYWTNEGFLYAS